MTKSILQTAYDYSVIKEILDITSRSFHNKDFTGSDYSESPSLRVCLKDLRIATNVVVKKEHIMKVLNGKLVALCQHASDTALFTLTDKPLVCRGHGLIRGVDWDKEMLYMITPVPSDELGSVDTLVYADWAPELLWHESQLPLGTVLPYRTSTENKQLMSTPRRRFNNPLQLLKMAGGVPN
ncbi:jg10296 [Pararge aegeria aegeria]|uniref:Jg10296 protein n=1 Tax=Pararge aegeria aegeria TaxID=348720 RepID=A0A8S4SHW9_9NEOP|nr:jg10296 [Pararge aegeria aegeria]